jgi:hypothetical protein
MRQQISRLSVHQTAKVLAILYGMMGLLVIPFFLVLPMLAPGEAEGFGIGLALLFPLIYAVFGYVFVAIGCLLYNLVAGWVGGIEVEMRAEPDGAPQY